MTADPAPRTPRRGRGRPPGSAGTGATRERIVAAAAELFAERGYHATPMTSIAEAAALSQTGLLHHFPSKEGLLAAVLEQRDLRDFEAIASRRAAPARGWQVYDDMVELVRLNAGREGIVRLFTSLAGEAVDPDHPGHEWLGHHHDSAVALLTAALHDAVDDGAADPAVPAQTIARQLVALMDGLQLQWLMAPDRVDMAQDVAEYVVTLRARWGREPGAPAGHR
ncbi:TetR/AcrR family transcriptional regulator [Nostocoides sp. HKS02]|uniref:TetR/AcrR family transcriptional regulator n=1 Tax=Nostocoides sp. HKS02 TaxID=1813880 RepID=UPI0012B47B21|nr:TetR/AcrR family transcriptional regulator [Tetrasphaera sp. HKS02]QGN58674.1 TetR family transcriptional regulator [Tetrasphaera sp. HKS02]